ncbi:MAG: hypothetical protein HYU69_12190 [Bacteroidetes bacterium]|nr:hypothetical protein [Bacteroidota bacterium]
MIILNEKKIILSLIKDDLTNTKLVSGLNALGLNADDYNLYLGEKILSMMGFEESEQSEMVYEKIYLAMGEKVKEIDITESKEKLNELAEEIYDELLEAISP